MVKDWDRPSTRSTLEELTPEHGPERIPTWAVALAGVVLGVLLMAALVGATDLLGGDTSDPAQEEAAYNRGFVAGEESAETALTTIQIEAEAAAYDRGRQDGLREATPDLKQVFEISPFLHFAVPLDNVDRGWLEQCPAAVPTLLLVLHGITGCYDLDPPDS